jgi:hypothetical protein
VAEQVEIWFSKIERDVIARGVFTSVKDLGRKLCAPVDGELQNWPKARWGNVE